VQASGEPGHGSARAVDSEAQVLEIGRARRFHERADSLVVVGLLADGRHVDDAQAGVDGALAQLREHGSRRGEDFLLHVAVADTDALYAFVIDRLTERREVADVRTSVVYEHIRRPVLEPLGDGTK
jgi:DNA-binding Lrp family transcriptional regulator